MNRQLLLSFQGPHHPEILSRLGALLDSWLVLLLDLHGLEQDQIFSGLWQLEWVSEQDPQLMEKSLCSRCRNLICSSGSAKARLSLRKNRDSS